MKRFVSTALLIAACFAGMPTGASAAGASVAVTVTSTTVKFTVNDMKTTNLAGSATVSASVVYTTSAAGSGTIVVTPPATLAGASTATLSTRNISVQCVRTSGDAHFTSSGIVTLNGATTCATLASGRSAVTTAFTITLYLNDTATTAPLAFDASTFGPGTVTVSGTAS